MLGKFADKERFEATLGWLLSISDRHPEHMKFGLIHLGFLNARDLARDYGVAEMAKRLNLLALRLRKVLQGGDLVSVINSDFWVLVPYTDPVAIWNRVDDVATSALAVGLEVFPGDIEVYTIGRDELHTSCPHKFLARINKNRIKDPVFLA